MQKIPKIAIIGRTNVGKSTLFNAIGGRKSGVTKDTPGVTRDRHFLRVVKHGLTFDLIDTGGLVGEEHDELHKAVQNQTRIAIQEADQIIVVFDGLSGVHPLDSVVTNEIRASGKPVVWVVNKCEKQDTNLSSSEFYALGIDEIIPVSAAHRQGIKEILRRIKGTNVKESKAKEFVDIDEEQDLENWLGDDTDVRERKAKKSNNDAADDSDFVVSEDDFSDFKNEENQSSNDVIEEQRPIKIALVGKPNVGKSSIINRILGEDRLITSAIAGTTRDSIDVQVKRDGKEYIFVDTAGLRRKSKIEDDTVERYSNLRTLKALAQSDVVVVVLDGSTDLAAIQDTKIAGLAHERGKGLIFVVNKWDLVEKDHKTVKAYTDAIYDAFGFARYAPILYVSALSGRRCPSILETVGQVYEAQNHRVKTSDANRILEKALERKSPPIYRGEPIKFYFLTQVGKAPPTFALVVNNPRKIHFSYLRYLKNCIRDFYPFAGVDIKLSCKKKEVKEKKE